MFGNVLAIVKAMGFVVAQSGRTRDGERFAMLTRGDRAIHILDQIGGVVASSASLKWSENDQMKVWTDGRSLALSNPERVRVLAR